VTNMHQTQAMTWNPDAEKQAIACFMNGWAE
jgi:hypothetical protein